MNVSDDKNVPDGKEPIYPSNDVPDKGTTEYTSKNAMPERPLELEGRLIQQSSRT